MFSRKQSNKSQKGTKFGESILSLAILSITLLVIFLAIMPSDIMSTAYWLESRWTAPLGTLPAGLSFLWFVLKEDVAGTWIAASVALFTGQAILMYSMATGDGWLANGQDSSMKEVVHGLLAGNLKVSQVNPEKLTEMLLLLLLISVDTLSDAGYYNSSLAPNAPILEVITTFLGALAISLLINTVLSEYLGVRASGLWFVALAQFKGALLDDFPSLRRKGNKRNKSQPKPPKPQRPAQSSLPQRTPKPSRVNKRPSPPPPREQPFAMESRTTPSMNITMPEPSFDE